MRAPLLIGVLLFLGFAVVNAPAGLLRTLLADAHDGARIELLQPTGTLWRGSGELYLGGRPMGRIEWDLRAAALLRGRLSYHVRLEGEAQQLNGELRVGFGEVGLALDGRAAGAFVNQWLNRYDIAIGGDFRFRGAALRIPRPIEPRAEDAAAPRPAAGAAAGSTGWSGGTVRYALAGRAFEAALPPLVAHLGDGLEAVVYPQDGQTPLLRAQLLSNGFVRVGITRLLTEMLNNPWPGSSPDHDVVLELEERLF